MKRTLAYISLLIAMFSLTSCISYTGNTFTPSTVQVMPTSAQKAYLEEVTLNQEARTWVILDKQRKSGKSLQSGGVGNEITEEDCQEIATYISARHPEIFSNQKEGAVPVKLEIDGQAMDTDFSMLMAGLSGLTFKIIPSGIYSRQTINLLAESLEDSPRIETQSTVLEVTHKSGLSISPFTWIGASDAHTKKFVLSYLAGVDEMWHNYFLTPEFADNAAFVVNKLLEQKK